MDKNQFRAVIKHLYLKGLTPKEIKAELDEVHGSSAPVFATVYNWVNVFKRGRTSTKDKHRSGRPIGVTTPEMVDKIHDMVLNDRRIKVREIVEATGVSQGTVFSILHEQLGVKKISAGWVPRLLTVESIRNRVANSDDVMALFRRDPNEFLTDTVSATTATAQQDPLSPTRKRAKIAAGFKKKSAATAAKKASGSPSSSHP